MSRTSERDRTGGGGAGALTSPAAILAAGAGAAVGIIVSAPVGIPVLIAGALGAGAGFGAGAIATRPKEPAAPEQRMDPATVAEPWRHAVVDALQAAGRFDQAVGAFPDGPLKVSMAGIAADVDRALDECWRIAQLGEQATRARARLYDTDARRDLAKLRTAIGDGEPTPVQAETITSLERQIETADRLDARVAATSSALDLLNARLDECVSRAIELSVTPGDASGIGQEVDLIVEDLEALRLAIDEIASGATSTADQEPKS